MAKILADVSDRFVRAGQLDLGLLTTTGALGLPCEAALILTDIALMIRLVTLLLRGEIKGRLTRLLSRMRQTCICSAFALQMHCKYGKHYDGWTFIF